MSKKPYLSKEPYNIEIVSGEVGGGGSGMRFISGEGEPGSDIGQPGDVYLDTESGDLYTNKNGSWTEEMNLKGPKGDPGEDGEDGKDGEDGEKGDKGDPGEDGYPSQEEWEDLLSEVDNIKSRLDDLENVE